MASDKTEPLTDAQLGAEKREKLHWMSLYAKQSALLEQRTAALDTAKRWLVAIRDDDRDGRGEIVYDQFAYERREHEYQTSAENALRAIAALLPSEGAGDRLTEREIQVLRFAARQVRPSWSAEADVLEELSIRLAPTQEPHK
jgi:hypothetical protein